MKVNNVLEKASFLLNHFDLLRRFCERKDGKSMQ